jgi:hypothetical protein
MSHLALAGEIRDEAGMASTVLATEVGYPGSSIAFAQLLSGMERSGLIEREVRGKRTYRITAVARPAAQPGRAMPGRTARRATRSGQAARGAAAAVLAEPEGGRHLAAEGPGDFDYDELARRLLVQVVRRLAVSPGAGPPPGHGSGGPQGVPGLSGAGLPGPDAAGPGPDADLQQTVAGLEQKLASVRSRQRRLTAENARLREQLRAAQQSLAEAEERASAARVTGQLGSPELQLLERLLSATRDQPGRQEEAGAG